MIDSLDENNSSKPLWKFKDTQRLWKQLCLSAWDKMSPCYFFKIYFARLRHYFTSRQCMAPAFKIILVILVSHDKEWQVFFEKRCAFVWFPDVFKSCVIIIV